MGVTEQIKDLAKQVADAKAAVRANGKELFQQAAAGLFVDHPNLISFSWTQYAPYFNDGDPCTFSAHTDDIRLRTTDGPERVGEECPDCEEAWEDCECEGEDFSDYDLREGSYPDRNDIPDDRLTPRQRAGKAALELLGLFDDEAFEIMFDAGRVLVAATGIEVEDYDHD